MARADGPSGGAPDPSETVPDPSEAPQPAQGFGITRRQRVRRWILLVLAVYGGSLLIVGLHVRAYPKVSPIDEFQHFDYMVKASRGDLVRVNELVGQTAMRVEACRGADAPGFAGPPCHDGPYNPGQFRESGVNTAASRSPVYYVVTGLLARGIVATTLTQDLFVAGRLAGAAWLGTALLIVMALLAEFQVPRLQRTSVVLLLVSAPTVLHATATVNPDGALVAAGGVVLLSALRWERGAWPWWWLPVISFAVFTLEPTATLAVLLVVVYLLARALQPATGAPGTSWSQRKAFGVVSALLVSLAVAYVVDFLRQRALAPNVERIELPRDTQFASPTLKIEHVLGQVGALVTPFNHTYLPWFLRSSWITFFGTVTGWLVVGSTLGAALLTRAGNRIGALGVATATATALGGPLIVLQLQMSQTFFPIPGRYGLPLVPAMLVLVAATLRKRVAALLGACFSAVVACVTISLLILA